MDKLQNFLSGLQKLEQRDKKCIELRGEYAEYIPSLVAVACFRPVWAKELSAPSRKIFLIHSMKACRRLELKIHQFLPYTR